MARRSISSCTPVAAVNPDDGGLVAIGLGIHAGSTECLGPIRGETLDMLGMETVAERMADYFVAHHPPMPGSGKKAQAVDAARCLEDSAHASMMKSVPPPGKTTAGASSAGLRLCLRATLPKLTLARVHGPAGVPLYELPTIRSGRRLRYELGALVEGLLSDSSAGRLARPHDEKPTSQAGSVQHSDSVRSPRPTACET
jgi:hypothetical protein